jgi:hypothetical protein
MTKIDLSLVGQTLAQIEALGLDWAGFYPVLESEAVGEICWQNPENGKPKNDPKDCPVVGILDSGDGQLVGGGGQVGYRIVDDRFALIEA